MTRPGRSGNSGHTLRRAVALAVICPALFASSAAGQVRGTAHAVIVRGGNSLGFGGVSGGGGLQLRRRLAFEGEFGLVVDDSAERSVAPILSAGGSLQFGAGRGLMPFVGAGFARLGDVAGPYVGAGAHYRASRAVALRLELRSLFPSADYRGCAADPFRPCDTPGTSWSVRAGVTFGIGP